MNNGIYLLLFYLVFTSCNFFRQEIAVYPTVTTQAVTVLADGSVRVQGKVDWHGSQPLYRGTSMQADSAPALENEQLIADSTGLDTFSVVYSWDHFEHGTPYYFRAWAANEHVFTLGKALQLGYVAPPFVAVPCSPRDSVVALGDTVIDIGTIQLYQSDQNACIFSFYSEYTFLNKIYIEFYKKIKTGIYETASEPSPGKVAVGLIGPLSNEAWAEIKGTIYVNEISPNTFDITLCEGTLLLNGVETSIALTGVAK